MPHTAGDMGTLLSLAGFAGFQHVSINHACVTSGCTLKIINCTHPSTQAWAISSGKAEMNKKYVLL